MNDPLDEEPGQNDRFDHWRRRAGLGMAPIVFLVLWWVPLAPPAAEHFVNGFRFYSICGRLTEYRPSFSGASMAKR